MKYLVHFSFPYFTQHSLIILNEVERIIEQGHQVDILTCDGGIDTCYGNITGDKKMCSICKRMQKTWIKLLSAKCRVFTYKDFVDSSLIETNFKYNDHHQIKSITYKGVRVGLGAYSSYVSRTKNLYPKIDVKFRTFFDELLRAGCLLTEVAQNYIERENPEAILMFSARHFEVRPFYDLPTLKGLKVECLEAGFSVEKDDYRGFNYGKYQPHSIEFHNSLINSQWNDSSSSLETKRQEGVDFYVKRRNNQYTGGPIFTENQILGELPSNWDLQKRNLVIFTSSEDEFVAVSDEYSSKALFSDQFTGILHILDALKNVDDIHVYVRVHPHQKKIGYKYHLDLYKLNEIYKNLTVIPATNSVSSYSLIDNAEKVIVFGSTIGMEAAYWKKPVILLNGATYYFLSSCYIPKNHRELERLLLDRLVPLKSENVLKFGRYMIVDRGYKFNYLRLIRFRVWFINVLKINRESYLDLFIRLLRGRRFASRLTINERNIPKIEL